MRLLHLTRFLVFSLLIISVSGCSPENSRDANLVNAEEALKRGDFTKAKQLSELVSPQDRNYGKAKLLLGSMCERLGNRDQAIEQYRAVDAQDSVYDEAQGRMALIALSKGQVSDSLDHLNSSLRVNPKRIESRTVAINLLEATGQRRLADAHLRELQKFTELPFKQLVMLIDFDRKDPDNERFLVSHEKMAPNEPAIQTGLGVNALLKGELATARRYFTSAIANDANQLVAQGFLGELLVEDGDLALNRWYAKLPNELSGEPEIWTVRGLWAARHERYELSARCLSIAARDLMSSYRAIYKWGVAESQVHEENGAVILRYAESLFELHQSLSRFLNTANRDEEAMQDVAARLVRSGRCTEANAWANSARPMFPLATWIDPLTEQVRARESSAGCHDDLAAEVRSLVSNSEAVMAEFRSFLLDVNPSVESVDDPREEGTIRFEDESSRLGIELTYHAGIIPNTVGVRMQESTGGGIAVIDFDVDDSPDLFFTQGHDWPRDSDFHSPSPGFHDCLFRQVGDRFVEVSEHAGLKLDTGFGQGCTSSDFNNDGFPDLYVATIGGNQLLLNLGDGTFRDISSAIRPQKFAWTSSCLMVDLNADGNPDIFDVNYVEGPSLFRRVCNETQCTPSSFHPSPDHLFLSSGDGTFSEFEFPCERRWGSGLGIVAFQCSPIARLEGGSSTIAASSKDSKGLPCRLDLFIANDHEPNFLLMNAPSSQPENLALTDEALLRGVALSKDGRPTASMGVASGDANGDNIIDLFVTNYKGEASNLYLQSKNGFFEDSVERSGLLATSIRYIKWGTQFLDADNDSDLDLVIANGHVGDFRLPGIECYMPTQFFRNNGRGEFQELTSSSAGEYFERKLLGRCVALVDWNRDGRIDFVAYPINAPAAVLTNQTIGSGDSVAVRLHAVHSARDAIGAIVTIETSSGTKQQQLTGGDGYQVSNERIMRFGLGHGTLLKRLTVHWPSGTVQTFDSVSRNGLWDIVEGKDCVQTRSWPSPGSTDPQTVEGSD